MEYDFLLSPRARLSLHIERLGKIVSAVYMLSPIEASHLLVAACMESCKLNEELDFYGAYDKTINILIEGFRHDKPILDENMEIIAKQIEILKNGAKQYYNAYSIERESGRSIYDEDKKTISKISRDSLESWMKREKECLTFIESITTHLSFKESPSCITPFPDVNSYHEYMWEMVCVLEKMIRDCMSKSRRIDELVSSPIPEMVSCYLRWKYQVFKEEVWPDSECKIKFDSAWKDNNSPSRNYNEKLAFLEEEKGKYLSSPNKKHATILWEILHINYNTDDGTCDFETAGDTIIGHWEKIRDAELKYVDEYAEKLIMASYIEGIIKRLKEEQEKKDEPADLIKDMSMQVINMESLANSVSHDNIQSSEIPKSVKSCFKFANDYVREAIENIVKKYYLSTAANLALIEVVLFDHGLLFKRTAHNSFVCALKDWGILDKGVDVGKSAACMAGKLKSPFPKDGYKEWGKSYLNERELCKNIAGELPADIKYNR